MAYLREHQPNWNKTFLQLSHILFGPTVALVSQPIIIVIIHLKVLVDINSLLWIISKFSRVFEFEFKCEGGKCFRGVVNVLCFTISGLLLGFKLAEDTFGDQIEDMGEATSLVSSTREVLDGGG